MQGSHIDPFMRCSSLQRCPHDPSPFLSGAVCPPITRARALAPSPRALACARPNSSLTCHSTTYLLPHESCHTCASCPCPTTLVPLTSQRRRHSSACRHRPRARRRDELDVDAVLECMRAAVPKEHARLANVRFSAHFSSPLCLTQTSTLWMANDMRAATLVLRAQAFRRSAFRGEAWNEVAVARAAHAGVPVSDVLAVIPKKPC